MLLLRLAISDQLKLAEGGLTVVIAKNSVDLEIEMSELLVIKCSDMIGGFY